MARQPDKTKLLLVTEDTSLTIEVTRKIHSLPDYELIFSDSYIGLNSMISSGNPDLLLLDFNFEKSKIFDFIDEFVLTHPELPIVVIIGPDNIQNSNSVILSGARAFITTPLDLESLEKTLNRVIELTSRAKNQTGTSSPAVEQEKDMKGEIFVVFSPKGGVGCTTIATNLALAMRKQHADVLLLDGKFLFGHVSLALNIRTANSIIDLLGHVGNLDEGLIRQVTIPHPSGIDVLPAPNSLSEGQGIRPGDLFKVIGSLKEIYDVIIIDAGNYLDENTVTLMDAATYLLLVLTPEIASMRDARKFLDVARNLGYSKSKIKLVLNKSGRRAGLHADEIERVIKSPVAGTIPLDNNAMPTSMNEGAPIIMKKQRHEASRSFIKLARDLSDLPKVSDQPDVGNAKALDQSAKLG